MSTTVASNSGQSHQQAQRRKERYAAVQWARSRSKRRGARGCMLPRDRKDGVRVHGTATGDVGVEGVKRCASPWACLCCSPAIGETRARELDQAFAAWLGQGGTLLFVTATLAHDYGDDLDALLEALQWSWSRTWRWEAPRYSQRKGMEGVVLNGERLRPAWYAGQARTVETTYGSAGWHPHVHAAVFVEAGHDPEAVADWLRETLAVRWADSLGRKGRKTRLAKILNKRTGEVVTPGWDVRPITSSSAASDYLTKVEGGWGAGLELARLDLKRSSGVKPFDLLAAAMQGDQAAEALWFTYEKATHHRRRIVVSPGLMARCGVEVVEDDEAAEGTLRGEEITVTAEIPGRHWIALFRRGEAAEVVNAVALIAKGGAPPGVWRWPPGWLR